MIAPLRIDEHALTASICRDSFYHFVQEFFGEIITQKPIWNWHIRFICDEMQVAAERVFAGHPKEYDLIFNVPPGSTKSTIVSVCFPVWTWLRMPHARHIGGAYAGRLTLDLGRRAKDIFTSDKFRACFPELEIRRDVSANGYFMNTAKGSIRRTTVGSVIIGEHADFIEIDDPLDPEGARSDPELETANTWCTETIAQRKVDQGVSLTILVMQRLSQNDPTGYMLAKAAKGEYRIRHICLPAIRNQAVRPVAARANYDSATGLLDPRRLPASVLDEKRALGVYMFAGQYLQSPVPLGGGMFRVSKLQIATPPPERRFTQIIRYWDKAATGGGGAYTAGVKMGMWAPDPSRRNEPEFWVFNVSRGQWATDEREAIIDQTANADGRSVVLALENEGGSSGKDVALMTLRRHAGRRVVMDRPTGDKAMRADPVSTQVNAGNVKLAMYGDDRDAWIPAFLDELKHFPNSTFKDQVDALSGAFKLLTNKRRAGAMKGT